MKLSPTNESVY